MNLSDLPEDALRRIRSFLEPCHCLLLDVKCPGKDTFQLRSTQLQKLSDHVAWSGWAFMADRVPDFDRFVVGLDEVLSELCSMLGVGKVRIDFERRSSSRGLTVWYASGTATIPDGWAPSCLRWIRQIAPENRILAFETPVKSRRPSASTSLLFGYRHEIEAQTKWDLRSSSGGYDRFSRFLYDGRLRKLLLSKLNASPSQMRCICVKGDVGTETISTEPTLCKLREFSWTPLMLTCRSLYSSLCETRAPREFHAIS
jgi:hypothetical protein